MPILAALKAAHDRGIDVRVIVDKTSARVSKSGSRYSAATYLSEAYRRISAQLSQKAAREPIGDTRRDLEAQAEHFLLLAEAMEGTTPTNSE